LRKSAALCSLLIEDALQDSNRVLDLDPTFTLALASRAECELQLNNLDAARLDYNKALELDPVSAIALQGLGLIALHAQDPKTALTYFNRAIQLNLYPPPYIPRAVAEIALESYHDAILDLSQAERLDPKNQDGPETLLWVARALNGDLDAANAELRAYLTERKSTGEWDSKERVSYSMKSMKIFFYAKPHGPLVS